MDQELDALRAMSGMYKRRIALLRELQVALEENSSQLADLPDVQVRALREPLLPVTGEMVGGEDTRPAASVGDFLVSKAVVPQESEVAFVRFLPLRNQRTSAPTPMGQVALPSTLLVAAQVDGTLRLFAPSGELAASFSTGHRRPLAHVAVSPMHDEYVVISSDAWGIIRVHKVSVRQRRVSKEEKRARRASTIDKASQHLGSHLNVTVLFNKQMRVPNATNKTSPARVTTLAMASQQGTKYFIAGDVDGVFTIFTRNGTLHARIETGLAAGIQTLYVHLSNVVYTSGGTWGFVDLEKMEVRRIDCPRFEGAIVNAIIDSQQQGRVIAADEGGDLWVFNVQEKRECRIEHRFPKASVRPPVDLASVRGFALTLGSMREGGDGVALAALNMSHVGKRRSDPVRAVPVTVWRRVGLRVRAWTVHKRYQQGDLLAFLSEDGMEIEIFEMLMHAYVQPAEDNFSNFKLPVFAVAIVLVLCYQYVQGKGAFDPSLAEGGG